MKIIFELATWRSRHYRTNASDIRFCTKRLVVGWSEIQIASLARNTLLVPAGWNTGDRAEEPTVEGIDLRYCLALVRAGQQVPGNAGGKR